MGKKCPAIHALNKSRPAFSWPSARRQTALASRCEIGRARTIRASSKGGNGAALGCPAERSRPIHCSKRSAGSRKQIRAASKWPRDTLLTPEFGQPMRRRLDDISFKSRAASLMPWFGDDAPGPSQRDYAVSQSWTDDGPADSREHRCQIERQTGHRIDRCLSSLGTSSFSSPVRCPFGYTTSRRSESST